MGKTDAMIGTDDLIRVHLELARDYGLRYSMDCLKVALRCGMCRKGQYDRVMEALHGCC